MAIKTQRIEIPDETYTHKNQDKKMEVYREQHPIDPRTHDQTGTMVCVHSRYNLGDKQPAKNQYRSHEHMRDQILENKDVKAILPLYLYDHRQQSISTTPFRSNWDSMKIGFIYTTKDQLDQIGVKEENRTTEQLEKWLKSEVETYDDYLRGNQWRYVLYEDGEEIDSCSGFNGDNRERLFETAGETMEDYSMEENQK